MSARKGLSKDQCLVQWAFTTYQWGPFHLNRLPYQTHRDIGSSDLIYKKLFYSFQTYYYNPLYKLCIPISTPRLLVSSQFNRLMHLDWGTPRGAQQTEELANYAIHDLHV